MINTLQSRLGRFCTTGLVLTLIAGCGALGPAKIEQPYFYSLDSEHRETQTVADRPAAKSNALPTLIINPPRAASGFDSQRIVYVREAHQLEYYAHSEWIDTPARMLAPLIVPAVENTGALRAVVLTPSAAAGDLRLDTQIVRLQHESGDAPSRVRLTLRATLVDNETRIVLASREFDETVVSASETPYGGVVAANSVVQIVLKQLASFCAESAAQWRPPAAER